MNMVGMMIGGGGTATITTMPGSMMTTTVVTSMMKVVYRPVPTARTARTASLCMVMPRRKRQNRWSATTRALMLATGFVMIRDREENAPSARTARTAARLPRATSARTRTTRGGTTMKVIGTGTTTTSPTATTSDAISR